VIGDIVDASDYDYPVNIRVRAEDPASGSAFERFPDVFFCFVPGMTMPELPSLSGIISGLFGHKPAPPPPPPAPRIVGATMLAPMSGFDAVVNWFLPRYRPNLPDLKVIGRHVPSEFAELAKAVTQGSAGMAVEEVGVRIEYTSAGRPFEEEIWTVKRQWDVPSYGPMGTLIQTNWQLFLPIGWRAPRGTLDSMRPLFLRVLNSFHYNPRRSDPRREHIRGPVLGPVAAFQRARIRLDRRSGKLSVLQRFELRSEHRIDPELAADETRGRLTA
jgi:hypothetical protein